MICDAIHFCIALLNVGNIGRGYEAKNLRDVAVESLSGIRFVLASDSKRGKEEIDKIM